MNISYMREFKHNYLVIRDDKVLHDLYEIKMLTKNSPEGLLSCSEKMINAEGFLYYDITSKQSLKNIFEKRKITLEMITGLFRNIKNVLENMEQFLLYDDGLMLQPEYIYTDIDSDKYFFLYYPGNDNNGMTELTDFLTDRIDNDDIRLVEGVYRLAQMTPEDGYSTEEAVKWFLDNFAFEEPIEAEPKEKEDDRQIKMIEETEPVDSPKRAAKGFWEILSEFFGHKKTKEPYEDIYEEEIFDEQNTAGEKTMFIPWEQKSEHKLYGMGKSNKNQIDLNNSPITVGKLQGAADVIINDESISRLHAKFTAKNGKYWLADLNSTNGTYKNGLRLSPNESVIIEPGDEIGLGKLKFIYR